MELGRKGVNSAVHPVLGRYELWKGSLEGGGLLFRVSFAFSVVDSAIVPSRWKICVYMMEGSRLDGEIGLMTAPEGGKDAVRREAPVER